MAAWGIVEVNHGLLRSLPVFYDRFSRLLHLLFAIGISAQLLVSNIMEEPDDGYPGDFFYEIHERIGISLLALLVIYWLWSLVRRGPLKLGHLFPWFSAAGRRALIEDIRRYLSAVLAVTLPSTKEPSPLAGAIQGLGLLVATGMAVSGTVIFLFAPETGELRGPLHEIEDVHEALGGLMWAYLAVHVGAAVLHEIFGQRILFQMFSFRKKKPDN
ncbi:cytochrome b/b6 domain-containing protein [uncultured Sneathiella sp.]|uniref:cytochrome b/b6 domain-containing protein n=2 Tax=uncultured Sneathiella sp. TaxID=879315 RepID=UPI0030D92E14|tara:strand:+ start:202 stop:846 length:645 start_codon:yes stop_codon:yes gene_type:complete